MVFSSILFLFKFLPIAFLIYYVTPKKLKNLVILIASLLFYAWGEPKYIVIMFASIFVDFIVGVMIEKNRDKKAVTKIWLGVSICFNLGMLMFFKYTNFFIENFNAVVGSEIEHLAITLPLGISFYTFQTMSYSIDVYKNKVKAERNIINFGAFVCLFPQLIAGPIVKYTDISTELKSRSMNLSQIEDGIRLFIMGLASKVLIANNVGLLWDEVQSLPQTSVSSILAWLSIIAYSFQIYFDFSGYSLMAIGLGKMLGFNFPQNFNFPYISRSVTEFWRRWHMTLSGWFKEYVYIPLGGNRKGKIFTYVNLFIVWFLTGFWHGAGWNFVLWGLYFFVLLVIEKQFLLAFLEKSKVFSRIYLIIIIIISWVIFALPSVPEITSFIAKMFSFSYNDDWIYYLRNYAVVLILACVFSTPLIKVVYEKIKNHKLLVTGGLAVLFLLCVAYLVDSSYNPFLYFRF